MVMLMLLVLFGMIYLIFYFCLGDIDIIQYGETKIVGIFISCFAYVVITILGELSCVDSISLILFFLTLFKELICCIVYG